MTLEFSTRIGQHATMKSIFIRLYAQLLGVLILAALVAYISTNVVNAWRLSNYIEEVAGGTFSLIAEGVARHDGQRRGEWLAVVKRITGLEIRLIEAPWEHDSKRIIDTELRSRSATVMQALPLGDSYIVAEVNDIDEPLARVTALLVLNELGRFEKGERQNMLMNLQQKFGYPVSRLNKTELALSQAQMRRLERGDVFVALENSTAEQSFLKVYAPYGKSRYALVLGPLPLFTWYPPVLIWTMVGLVLLLVGISGVLLVRPLEKRLDNLVSSVDKIGQEKQFSKITVMGDDGLGRLATHINSMAERIQSLLQHQRELTHAVSHELRTPIARLRFRLELLAAAGDDEERAKRISGIEKDLTELNSLVDEILTYAKLDSDSPGMNMETLDVQQLMDNIKDSVDLIKGDIDIEWHCEMQEISGDRHYLHRALQNLTGNALKFAASVIRVSVKKDGQDILICVEDDGCGVPEENWESIFEPFARVDSSRNRKSGGYGLGLAITKQIVQWHEGVIKLTNSDLGGAKFLIKLPSKSNV